MKIYNKLIITSLAAASLLPGTGAWAQMPADSTKVNVAFGQVEKQDLLGGVSVVNVEELLDKNYYTYSLDGLQGLIGGYSGTTWGAMATHPGRRCAPRCITGASFTD